MIKAQIKLGEMLKEMPKNEGAKGNPGGQGAKFVRYQKGTAHSPTYFELGIDKKDASRCQQMAESKREITAKIEELQYFYLKYIHVMNEIRILLKNAIEIKNHVESLEGKSKCQN